MTEAPKLGSQESPIITPIEFTTQLYRRSMLHLIAKTDTKIIAAFSAQEVSRWYLQFDREAPSSYSDDSLLDSGTPIFLAPTQLHGGFIAETPGGYLGMALHTGNDDMFWDSTSLKLEYAMANRRETSWLFTEQPPRTVSDLRAILYASGSQSRPIGRYEVNSDKKLEARVPGINYPGINAYIISDQGQTEFLSAKGLTEGIDAIDRFIIARSTYVKHLDKVFPVQSDTSKPTYI